ncbi:MAG: hypothetical protein Q7T61_09905 [Caulobacter sp.]|nr:hypothetical protein [Caulobacter sp.]
MRPIAFALLTTGLLALAACSPEAPGGGETAPPADAPPAAAEAPGQPQVTTAVDPAAPFRQDFALIGTEPFWRLDVKGSTLVLSRPDPEPELTAPNAALAATSGKAVWTGQAGTTSVVATLTAGTCSDGMSDRVYPYAAEVKVGDLVLKGCGISSVELARQPAP